MKIKNEEIIKKISWSSISAGIITVLAISILFSILGTSLGFSTINPMSYNITSGSGFTIITWSIISIIISLIAGSFVCGYLAENNGFIHGFLIWSISLVISIFLGIVLLNSIIKTTSNAFKMIASTSGNILLNIGSLIDNNTNKIFNNHNEIFSKIKLDNYLHPENFQNKVLIALNKSGVISLQPDFMQNELNSSVKDLSIALKAISLKPKNIKSIMYELINKFKKHYEKISNINESLIKQILLKYTDMNMNEINKTTKNLMEIKNKNAQIIKYRLSDIEKKINHAEEEYNILKNKTKMKAKEITKSISRGSLWLFLSLIIANFFSLLSCKLGVKVSKKNHLII